MDITGIFIGPPSRGLIDPKELLSRIPGFNRRYSQYVRKAIANIRQVQGLELPEVPEPDGGLGWWSPLQTLAVLTYGPSSHLNVELISEIRQLTGQALPQDERLSRFEVAFEVEYLMPLLNDFREAGFVVEMTRQYPCGPYRVDFRVELRWLDLRRGCIGSRSRCQVFLLEFDEAYHHEPVNRLADEQRDNEIELQTGLRPLRIRHSEQELWAAICHDRPRLRSAEGAPPAMLVSVEEYLQELLEGMAWKREGRHIDINWESAQSAYTCNPAGYLRYSAQPGRDLRRIAERLGWRLSPRHSGNLTYHRLTAPQPTTR